MWINAPEYLHINNALTFFKYAHMHRPFVIRISDLHSPTSLSRFRFWSINMLHKFVKTDHRLWITVTALSTIRCVSETDFSKRINVNVYCKSFSVPFLEPWLE